MGKTRLAARHPRIATSTFDGSPFSGCVKPPKRNRNVSIFSFYRLCIPAQPDLAHMPSCPLSIKLSHVEFFLYRTLGAPFGAPPLPHPRRFRYCVGPDPRMRRHLKLGPPVVRLQKHFDVMRGSQLRLRRPLLGDLAHPPARNEAPMSCPPAPQEPRRQLVEQWPHRRDRYADDAQRALDNCPVERRHEIACASLEVRPQLRSPAHLRVTSIPCMFCSVTMRTMLAAKALQTRSAS